MPICTKSALLNKDNIEERAPNIKKITTSKTGFSVKKAPKRETIS